MMNNLRAAQLHNVKLKFLLLLLSMAYVMVLVGFTLRHFRSEDPVPDAEMISIDMRKQFRDIAAQVRVGLYVKSFSKFDFVANNFIMEAVVWFEFNKNEITLETIEKFSFERSEILSRSDPKVTMDGNKINVKYNVIVSLHSNLEFQRFPLEDHRLSIELINEFVSPNEMYFDDDVDSLSFVIDEEVFTADWEVESLRAFSGYTALHYDQYHEDKKIGIPKAVFIIDFKKVGVKKMLVIFVPLFASVLLALLTFLMSFNSYISKITLSATAITALLGYRFVIENMSPKVGYFTVTDKFFIFFLVLSFFIFIFQLLLIRQYMISIDKDKFEPADRPEADAVLYPPRITERINTYGFFVAIALFVVVVTYILW
ncbi:hypothetical protein K2W90_02875 [Candidatus Babeliales bacterium]|nr:hypothetical protein [Candidatus Babeliales bacterium]